MMLKKGPLPDRDVAATEIAGYLRTLGIVVPEARPIGWRWDNDVDMVELDEDAVAAMTDDELDDFDGCIITPDTPNLDELADILVSMARQRPDIYPRRWSWRRWRLTLHVSSFLYTSGLSSSGGSSMMCGDDPVGGFIYALPSRRSFSKHARPYVLGRYRGESHGY